MCQPCAGPHIRLGLRFGLAHQAPDQPFTSARVHAEGGKLSLSPFIAPPEMTDPTHPEHLPHEAVPAEPSAVDPLQVPMEVPLKVMGKNEPGFTETIADVLGRHIADFDPKTLDVRHSKGGNYLSLTATFTAHSRQQLDDLYRELSALPQVSYLI